MAVNQPLAGRDAAIAAYEMGMAKALDTTELEAQQQDGEVTAFSEKVMVRLAGLRNGLRGWPPDFHFQKRLHLRGLSRVNTTLPIICINCR